MNRHKGSISVWTAIALVAFIIALGIGVDFSGHIRASQSARAAARGAARAAGQALLARSEDFFIDEQAAKREAQDFLHHSGWSGSTVVTSDGAIQVYVTGKYDCSFLPIIGIWEIKVAESAAARGLTLVDPYES